MPAGWPAPIATSAFNQLCHCQYASSPRTRPLLRKTRRCITATKQSKQSRIRTAIPKQNERTFIKSDGCEFNQRGRNGGSKNGEDEERKVSNGGQEDNTLCDDRLADMSCDFRLSASSVRASRSTTGTNLDGQEEKWRRDNC